MIKLSYNDINNQIFQEAVKLLGDSKDLDAKTLFDYIKLKKRVDAETKKIRTAYTMLLKKYMKLDDNKNVIRLPTGDVELTDRDAFNAECDVLWEQSFEFKCSKFAVKLLQNAGLTASQIGACEAIIDMPDDTND